MLHKVIDAIGRLGIAPPVMLPEDGSKHDLKRAVLALYAVPGTFEMCTTCGNHTQRYRGAHHGQAALADTKGWFYCDCFFEAETIVWPIEGECHWYEPGIKTHRTPLVGVRQALNPDWRPPARFLNINEDDMIPEAGTVSDFKRVVLAQDVDAEYISSLVWRHEQDTGFCSVAGHMRHCSTTYAEIMQYGRLALPGIFQWMYNQRVNHCYSSMAVMLLLMDIVKESPYEPEVEGGFAKYTVADADDAWLDWGYKHGYLNKAECPPTAIERKKWVNPMSMVERFLGVKSKSWWRRLLFWRNR